MSQEHIAANIGITTAKNADRFARANRSVVIMPVLASIARARCNFCGWQGPLPSRYFHVIHPDIATECANKAQELKGMERDHEQTVRWLRCADSMFQKGKPPWI